LVLLFWERHRPEAERSVEWMARQMRKVDGGMRTLAEWASNHEYMIDGTFGLADIAAGTVCRYLDVRFPDYPWRNRHPNLADYSNGLEQRPSFRSSVPVPQQISDKVV
jgi:glutathione S-transferase